MDKQKIYSLLKQYYGYESFKKGQEAIIEHIIKGRDVLGIMPTGAGKSICYQLPALIYDGVAIVISPLISLMKDQVDTLREMGIKAAFINSSLSITQIRKAIYNAKSGAYKLIYVAPERLETEEFIELLQSLDISLIAVDEAHCVSQWGHDFRPSYTRIADMISTLTKRPVLAAFTATATTRVSEDIVNLLKLKDPFLLTTGFNRENLYFEVNKPDKKLDFLLDYLQKNKEKSGIVYCLTRKTVDAVSDKLTKKGFSVTKYHAGLLEKDRRENQEDFIYEGKQIMVATNAFGMGIDKSNIRFVIHYNMPKNMESYYQEAGRAGRDGEYSECILLYSGSDTVTNKFLIEQNSDNIDKTEDYRKLQEMIDYCNTDNCLRNYILNYFSETDLKETCDNCSSCNNDIEHTDITIEAQKIMSCIKRMDEGFGLSLVADVLSGANTKRIRDLSFDKLSTYNIMREYPKDTIKELISYLVAENYVTSTGDKYPVLVLNPRSYSVLRGKESVFIKRVIQKKQQREKAQLTQSDSQLFDILRGLRRRIAQDQKVPPFVVFTDATLNDMCRKYPQTRTEFLNVAGVGENKLEKYGDDFLTAIIAYVDENKIEVNIEPEPIRKQHVKTKEEKQDTRLVTYELYKNGSSIDEIRDKRVLTLETIEGHLLECKKRGLSVNYFEGVVTEELEYQIINNIKEYGVGRLKSIKEALPKEVTYGMIKYVIYKMNYI
ncbi:DNA helicase RecQ [Alkaliphilus peptidifermentans]|uniref:DNA helicase RecQ n=1 Tax=Alkaliphilus peptidifermentans DSM 18978 TaxID=1120976 RepID=A0A1G5I200_9FIRM|nr:DNA helicase RecQ [Alkaliphilus peptidifermentans]SCY70053.1 ATP-dependent DNA helicase, RecQ-like [Alkaliphilus peptidifermentans DSM 18978]